MVKLYKNNEDVSILRVAYTTDGSTFSDAGLANDGIVSDCVSTASTVTLQNQSVDPGVPEVGCTGSYQGINNPDQQNNPPNGLNSYATNEGTPGGSNGTDTGSVAGGDATEMRWVGSAGSIITNPDGTYGLFLSGAWAADGDSDAFNQVFYSEGTTAPVGLSPGPCPRPVISTDYSFSASYNQDNNVNGDGSQPVGISAYYEGRAYGPSVVQNPNGTLTMVFAGYRFPKSIVSAGSVLGDQATAGTTGGATSPTWTVGSERPEHVPQHLDDDAVAIDLAGCATATSVAAAPTRPPTARPKCSPPRSPRRPGHRHPHGQRHLHGLGRDRLCQAISTSPAPIRPVATIPTRRRRPIACRLRLRGRRQLRHLGQHDAGRRVRSARPRRARRAFQISPRPASTATVSRPVVDERRRDHLGDLESTDVCTAIGLDVSYVGVGQCSLTAQVGDGTDYSAASGSPQTFNVEQAAPTTPAIANLPTTGTYGGGFTADVATDGDGTTSVTSSTSDVCTVSNNVDVAYVGVGDCTLTPAVADGTDYSAGTGSAQTFYVNQADYPVTVTGSQGYGGSPTFVADPSSGPSQPYTGTLTCTTVNGGTPISPSLAVGGTYVIDGSSCSGLSLTGSDAANYTISYTGSGFSVGQGTPSAPTISNLPASGTYGGGFTATVSTTGDGTTSVTSSTPTVCTASGLAVSYVGVGPCTLTAQVAAGTNYGAASGSAQTFSVGQATPSTPTITNLPASGTYGSGFTANVSTNGDGTTSVTSSTPSVCTASGLSVSYVGAGPCTLTAQVAAGTDYAAASGATQSFTVATAHTSTSTKSSQSPTVSGQSFTLSATVKPQAPGTTTPTGNVTFTFYAGGITCAGGSNTVALVAGVASCSISALADQSPLNVTAHYGGSSDYATSVANAFNQVINTDATSTVLQSNANPDSSGQPVTFSANISAAAPGAGTPTGKATWTISGADGTTVACASKTSGASGGTLVDTCTTATGALVASDSPYSVAVKYKGDANYLASSASGSETVQLGTSSTTVTATPSGSTATLVAKVTGSPSGIAATGKVIFDVKTEGGARITCAGGNTKTLGGTAKATCSVSGLTKANSPYSVTVSYGGDADFSGSASSTETFTG